MQGFFFFFFSSNSVAELRCENSVGNIYYLTFITINMN